MRAVMPAGALALFVLIPSLGRADDAAAKAGTWDYRVDIVTKTHAFGYEPAVIVSEDSGGPFVARDVPGIRTEIRGRMSIDGTYVYFTIEPYTAIPDDRIKVNLGGIETYALAKLHARVRVGLYHHSSHNFSDGGYGFGIDLNSFVLDADVFAGDGALWGGEGEWRLRFLGHLFWTGKASPYVFTRNAAVEKSLIGQSRWRAGPILEVRHGLGSSACAVHVTSAEAAPSSLKAECDSLFRLGPAFFGTLGEHVAAGPFLLYGRNFSRTDEFGSFTFIGGLRIELLFAEKRSKDPK